MKLLRLISLSVLLTSCAVKPPDVPVCQPLKQHVVIDSETGHLMLEPSPTCMSTLGEAECGHCTYIVSGKEIYIGENPKTFLNKKPWSEIMEESIYVPAVESYAPITAYMINACKQANCSNDLTKFKVKIDSVNPVKP